MLLFCFLIPIVDVMGGVPPATSNFIYSRAPMPPQNRTYFQGTLRHTATSLKGIFSIKGSPCVYNSECDNCMNGHSQSCIANRCQCLPISDHGEEANSYLVYRTLKNSNVDCIETIDNNPLLVYFDRGYKRCMADNVIETTTKPCFYHERYKSIVDGKLYCLNALDRIDMICTENKMCQDALNTTSVVGFCINGICHVKSVIDFNNYLLSDTSCSDTEDQYCREIIYDQVPTSHERHLDCSKKCLAEQGKSGLASSVENKCLCFKAVYQPPSLIK